MPFDITVTAPEAIALQPPWPLDLQQTLIQGFNDNPQLLALQAARDALLRQADRRAAELLPSLRLFAQAGVAEVLSNKPLIDLQGCCAATNIPELYSQSADWAAGLQLRWRLFDGGVTSGAAAASRAAAVRTEQTLARERRLHPSTAGGGVFRSPRRPGTDRGLPGLLCRLAGGVSGCAGPLSTRTR